MPVWLNVAEKPSVAKEVASVLSKGQCRTGQSQSRFNPVFEFKLPNGVDMLFTSVAGHLTEDEFPPETKNWTTYPLQRLFTVPVTRTVKEEFQGAKKNLEALAKRSTQLVLWLDCDREGENICFEVMDVVLASNRRLEVKRARFSALTERDLQHAVTHLTTPNKHLSEAVEARREMDLRIGAVFTRLQTVRFRERFANMPRVLSFGPCQFPTLGFVVKRHWERDAFVPEDFYHCTMHHENATFRWEYGNVFDAVSAGVLFEEMLEASNRRQQPVSDGSNSPTLGTGVLKDEGDEDNPQMANNDDNTTAQVTRVQQKQTFKYPPAPLNTVELQKLASQHLRISSEHCMTIAEGLYQQGILSYPRTETDEFSLTDEELIHLAAIQIDNPLVTDFANRLVQQSATHYKRPKAGGHNDHAHPPIHPLRLLPPGTGDAAAQSVYLLVTRCFLACMSPPAIAATTHVDAMFGGVSFHTSGQTVVDKGWLEVFPYEQWGSSTVPNYTQGQRFTPSEVNLKSGRTEAPRLLTETQLITIMDQQGIGTDATIAQHIKTVTEREYVIRDGGVLKPSPLGVALVSAYQVAGLGELVQPVLRAQMELAMGDIARGVATKEQVLEAAGAMYRDKLQKLTQRLGIFEEELCRHLVPNSGGAGGATGGGAGAAHEMQLSLVQSGCSHCGRCNRAMNLVRDVSSGDDSNNGFQRGYVQCSPCSLLLKVPLHNNSQLTPHTLRCPLCQFGVINVATDRGTSYTMCPWCFNNPPPAEAVADMESLTMSGGEFRCFQCLADCPLATGHQQVAITKCPQCPESLRLRTTSFGRMLACKNKQCSFIVTLPPASVVRPVPTATCSDCGGVKCYFRFTPAQMLPGLDDLEATMCIACDGRLRDFLVVKSNPAPQSAPAATSSSASSSTAYAMPTVPTSRGRGGNSARGGGGAGGGSGRGAGRGGRGGVQASAVNCECGVPSKRLTSRQQASAGKEFLTCGNNRACNFFQWIE